MSRLTRDMPRPARHSPAPAAHLRKRTLKFYQLFTMLVGTIVGVGWIVASSGWVLAAGPLGAVLAFGLGAVIMMAIGLCFAEAMAMYPDSGGTVAYVYEGFGTFGAFSAGWFLALTYIATNAFYIITLPWLFEAVAPALAGPVIYTVLGAPVYLGYTLMSVAIGFSLWLANYRGAHTAAVVQDIVVTIQFSIIALLGLAAALSSEPAYLEPMFVGESVPQWTVAVGAVLVSTPFWFAGFDVLPQALRERTEGFQLARLGGLIIGSTFVAFGVYAMVILAVSSLMPRSTLESATLPVFSAFATISPWLAKAVILAGILGAITTWNAVLFAGARVLQALSEAHVISPFFGPLHPRHRTPTRALALVILTGCGLGMLGRNAVSAIVEAASITLVVVFLLVCACVAKLRLVQPDRPRPYRVPGGLLIPVLGVVISFGILVLAVLGPILSPEHGFPVQWTVTLVWILFGAVLWRRGAARRGALAESDRRAILTRQL